MSGVCTGPGPCDVAPLGIGKNWVTKVGGLPLYIRAIAHALRRSGHSESESIQLAVGTVQRWARGGGKVTDATRARAATALAEWERKRAEAHLSGSDAVSIDLASITDGMCTYDPKGDERDTVSRQVKGINALAKSGRKTQAKSAMTALVKSKTNRARKMSDGTVRAHTAMEVQSGLSKMGVVDLAFDPSEARGVTGQWTTGSSGSAPGTLQQQAAAAGVDPAVLAAVAKSLGLTPGQVSLMAQQSKAVKAKKAAGGSGGGGASKAAAGKTQAARIAALKKAKAAYTAATKLEAQTTMAERAPSTKASDAKAAALNALPPDQRALFTGSVPPSGYAWTTAGKLVASHSVGLSGGTVTTTVDLSQMLPDIASVKKAASKLSKLPPPLRKVAAARLAARAKQLGCTLNLATPMDLRQAARDKAKASGATLPGTTSYPTQTRPLFDKAVMAVGRGGADHNTIRAYLIKRGKAMGWPTPDSWNPDGSLKDAAA